MLTRLPEPGRVKTRLVPALGPEGAAEVHRALAEAAAAEVRALAATGEAEVEVWHDGGSRRRMREWLGPLPRYRSQPAGDLGRRLCALFDAARRERVDRCVAVGSDCPAMTADDLRRALRALEAADLVVGPAADGGYWLIGLAAPAVARALPALFEGVDWGTDAVLGQTLGRAGALGLRVARLEELCDVDRPEDLAGWARWREPPAGSLSVVIPAIDEADRVGVAVASAFSAGAAEVVVADGGSRDATREVAAWAGAIVVEAPRGRARQMNAGAACAAGDALLFLHADTSLPPGAAAAARRALGQPGVVAGAFTFTAVGAGAWDPVLIALGRLRSDLSGHPYGDQGLFLRARTFRALAGFPDLPVMEDWELVRRLRRLGRVVIVPEPAVTSAAGFAAHGVIRSGLANLAAIAGYRAGIDPRLLAAIRGRVARRP